MSKAKRSTIAVRGTAVSMVTGKDGDDISLPGIAFEFASWVSVEFKRYLIKEFQRLKDEENDRLQPGWNLQPTLANLLNPARAGLLKLQSGELRVTGTSS